MKVYHSGVESFDIPDFKFHWEDYWLLLRTGVDVDLVKKEDGSVSIQIEPVFSPFFELKISSGQIILNLYFWRQKCRTIIIMKSNPWFWTGVSDGYFLESEVIED
jgi:hypothetical protein